ncbi:hypothetical protein SPRG_06746 [Saprolegnia parasitica CBS 223.65]|uniref:Uncharacterized protein n=1 Tax=Saprolegnia parasitica (strain CBS 223.65) TaxID=695850 RepID=A0A067CNV4_SAPPC|nr:hypothetical protein SPRG_06746 [Saprolegnia parasitica CBS 223.65]KDO28507.1 hypothetical protein SPRG_06746 [Saprolegnia parasitica CBS 223.65]|eukprot:XP_012200943.1 hypothetical protein SPRG_06746 [Saprolegnia parasitica CBS 223.65]
MLECVEEGDGGEEEDRHAQCRGRPGAVLDDFDRRVVALAANLVGFALDRVAQLDHLDKLGRERRQLALLDDARDCVVELFGQEPLGEDVVDVAKVLRHRLCQRVALLEERHRKANVVDGREVRVGCEPICAVADGLAPLHSLRELGPEVRGLRRRHRCVLKKKTFEIKVGVAASRVDHVGHLVVGAVALGLCFEVVARAASVVAFARAGREAALRRAVAARVNERREQSQHEQ